jgi:formylglycine-generating enzyme required for sulfatase activity
MGRHMRGVVVAVVGALATACAPTATPRGQIVLVVDTDAPAVAQLLGDEGLSAEAAIDSLRVDLIDSAEPPQIFPAGDPADWPISFGIATPEGRAGSDVTVWLRAFRAADAAAELVDGQSQLAPPPEAAITRLVQLPLPDEDISRVRVLLAMECWGRAADFVHTETCLDGDRLDGPARDGVEAIEESGASLVGSSPLARADDCRGSGGGDRRCIRGGFTLLGDVDQRGVSMDPKGDPVPLRPVHLSPFWMDATELTVAALHDLVPMLPAGVDPPTEQGSTGDTQYCTWLGPGVHANDALPVNCVDKTTAAELCKLRGGTLPSEAQWEHAAAGRGRGLTFPWGDTLATCCTASLSFGAECPAGGPEPAGSHPPEACGAVGDVTADGIVDLGGSVSELVADVFVPYSEGCWAFHGIAYDPTCTEGSELDTTRGASFIDGFARAMTTLRQWWLGSAPYVGLRCVYPDPAR